MKACRAHVFELGQAEAGAEVVVVADVVDVVVAGDGSTAFDAAAAACGRADVGGELGPSPPDGRARASPAAGGGAAVAIVAVVTEVGSGDGARAGACAFPVGPCEHALATTAASTIRTARGGAPACARRTTRA
ncbi:MAG TPA: hypothetical protein VHF47_08935, partial [Acidimicrobiales bacterium]|nr:hypothetical protein [Acidimicrobiales bacterium]